MIYEFFHETNPKCSSIQSDLAGTPYIPNPIKTQGIRHFENKNRVPVKRTVEGKKKKEEKKVFLFSSA